MSRVKFIEKYPNEIVRALSIKQPFASLMLHGKIETRTWDSKYFGWVLICASKAPYTRGRIIEIAGKDQHDRIEQFQISKNWMFHLGKAIAIGRLVSSDYMLNENSSLAVKEMEDKCFVKMNDDLYIHTYADVQAIEPFDWKGKLGWSTLDEETKSKIILI